jgi:hypothetical protein
MSHNKIITASVVAILFTGLAVTEGSASGGGHSGGFSGGGGFGGSGTGHLGGSFGGGVHMGGNLGGGNLGGSPVAARPQDGFSGFGMARGPGRPFSDPIDSSYYRMARGEPDHYGDRFHDRDHDHFRHRFLFAPYEDYGYVCDYSYSRTYWPGYNNTCVVPYEGWPAYD